MNKITHAAVRPQILPFEPLIVERLASHGVRTLADWKRLGRRRHLLFGVTPTLVKKLDQLAQVQK
jgi:hypothetical protein